MVLLLQVFFRLQWYLKLACIVRSFLVVVIQRELARQEGSEETNPFFYKEKLVCTLVLSEQSELSAFVYLGLYREKSDC